MGRVTRRKPEALQARPQGLAGRLFAFFEKYAMATTIATISAIIVGIAALLELHDRFAPEPRIEDGLHVKLDEQELAPLSGGTMIKVAGARVFSEGVKLRAQLSLKTPAPRLAINSIAIAPIDDVPPEVVAAVKAGAAAPHREEESWAGARPINTYLGVMKGGGTTVVYNDPNGQYLTCRPENLLDCKGRAQVIELNPTDATYTLDLWLRYADAPLKGLQIIAKYTIDGVDHETRSEPLYLHN
ncbi:hypothetical protein [Mesorhizobium sophorae]|uniref:hypothetical protein n=1 Tax=Mesorhizobium sophorae TaxID=1300294 RepID=UPI000BA3BD85|nr:hypothetical protein [Mesorhizobium sophorae]